MGMWQCVCVALGRSMVSCLHIESKWCLYISFYFAKSLVLQPVPPGLRTCNDTQCYWSQIMLLPLFNDIPTFGILLFLIPGLCRSSSSIHSKHPSPVIINVSGPLLLQDSYGKPATSPLATYPGIFLYWCCVISLTPYWPCVQPNEEFLIMLHPRRWLNTLLF